MCVLFVRVFAFRPNRFLPASTRFFRSFPSGPAASVRFPSSGLFSSAPFVRVSSSTGSVLLFHYRKITDFSLCGRHARPCRPIPIPLLSARSRRFVRSLSEPFPLPVVRALIFPEGVFYPATGKFPRLPPFAAAILAPAVRPVLVPFLSARSRRFCPFPFRAVSPSRRRYANFLSSGEICRLSRSETRRVRLPVRTGSAPVWLLGPAAPFCSPSFVLPPAFRCPLVLLLPSALTPLSPGLSVFSP